MKQLTVVLVPLAVAFGHVERCLRQYRVECGARAESRRSISTQFQIGRAEKMSMHKSGATGEVMLGGKIDFMCGFR